MRSLPIALSLVLILGCTAFAEQTKPTTPVPSTKPAAPTFVRGAIQKIDGKTLTVDNHAVTLSDKTVIVKDKKEVKRDALAVGQSITARIEGGVTVRIEIH